MSGGAIPDRRYRLSTFVGFRQPVIYLQAEFKAGLILLAWVDLSHTGQAYSAAEKLRARAVDRTVEVFAPQFELTSFETMELRVLTFDFVFSMCLE